MDSVRGFGSTGVTTTRDDGKQMQTHDKARSVPQPEKESAQQDKESWPTAERMLGMSNEELGQVDPVVMDLAVAKGIRSLADLDIGHYVRLADQWADDLRAGCQPWRRSFTTLRTSGATILIAFAWVWFAGTSKRLSESPTERTNAISPKSYSPTRPTCS